jgi:anti-anti-sigma regulatory factor
MSASGPPSILAPDPDPALGVFSATEPAPGGALVLTVRLDLDVATEAAAGRELHARLAGRRGPVVVDLTDRFLGVSGIRVLLTASALADRVGAPFAVVGAPRWLRELAPVLEVDEQLPFFPTLDAALTELTGEPVRATAEQDAGAVQHLGVAAGAEDRAASGGSGLPEVPRHERLVVVPDGTGDADADGTRDRPPGAPADVQVHGRVDELGGRRRRARDAGSRSG